MDYKFVIGIGLLFCFLSWFCFYKAGYEQANSEKKLVENRFEDFRQNEGKITYSAYLVNEETGEIFIPPEHKEIKIEHHSTRYFYSKEGYKLSYVTISRN